MNSKQKYTIGRASDNDIVIGHETVSRRHAEMTVDNERIVITDFNSNGDSKKQGWHDKLAGTLVVKDKKKFVRFE